MKRPIQSSRLLAACLLALLCISNISAYPMVAEVPEQEEKVRNAEDIKCQARYTNLAFLITVLHDLDCFIVYSIPNPQRRRCTHDIYSDPKFHFIERRRVVRQSSVPNDKESIRTGRGVAAQDGR